MWLGYSGKDRREHCCLVYRIFIPVLKASSQPISTVLVISMPEAVYLVYGPELRMSMKDCGQPVHAVASESEEVVFL